MSPTTNSSLLYRTAHRVAGSAVLIGSEEVYPGWCTRVVRARLQNVPISSRVTGLSLRLIIRFLEAEPAVGPRAGLRLIIRLASGIASGLVSDWPQTLPQPLPQTLPRLGLFLDLSLSISILRTVRYAHLPNGCLSPKIG